ncbi:DUF1240 domain-containing protein [Rahnella ecdela]|uniref:DUF1240 domain-containing protein n=1 Tax=Rahnella ecdela TaxID=2816250 RepID=A0ABS6LJG9_9GAMM|nr:DUF1240 domain-containing protein [Rahnella ecdela]MBU9847051.1 DUF1240 domain-containing protein [Rahnella ecdela]
MNKKYIQQWLIFKGGSIILMAVSLCYVYGVNDLVETFNTKSLIVLGDAIEYSGKVIICIGGIPMFIWVFFFALKMLFKKGIEPFKKYTTIGYIWMVISVVSFVLGFIASFVIPFILMVSPYTSCNVGKYSSYYVINPDLCKTIVPDQWMKK